MKFKTRRIVDSVVRLVGRSWPDVMQELQELLDKLHAYTLGIPSGFNELDPEIVEGGAPGTPGTETAGWAAGDHQHPLNTTGVPGGVADVSAQGAGPGVSLSGHTHAITLLTEKGQLITFNGSTVVAIGPGEDGEVPISDPLDVNGIVFGKIGGNSLTGPARLLATIGALDLRHYRRRKFLGLVDDNRTKGAFLGAGRFSL